ncbi:hypothetical protein GCM10022287_02100 [Gryllotalpicola koreensis]|uniref:mannan endo-1,4-beta-mannosidase n=2 Tax=Gryllotalpicola koreensis TaxID=993086 RepID=A0ABP7ZQC0_9MICO
MTRELANEPRNRSAGTGFADTGGAPLLKWADSASRLVKRLAPNQLVALGDEGFGLDKTSSDYPYGGYEGNDWVKLTSLPAIDYGTFHLYPVTWGETADPVGWGTKWITDHAAAAAKIGKPVVLGEFGLPIGQSPASADEATRDASYQTWVDAVQSPSLSGFQFWLLTALTDDGTLYGDYDGLRVVFPSSTATLFRSAAAAIAGRARPTFVCRHREDEPAAHEPRPGARHQHPALYRGQPTVRPQPRCGRYARSQENYR